MSWIVKGFGQVVAGNAEKAAAKQEMAIAKDEAAQLQEQAKGEIAAASFNSDRIRKRSEEILSTIKANAAAGGQSSTDPSVLAVQEKSIKEASIDQLLTMAAAQEDARMLRREARQTLASGKINSYNRKIRAWGNYAGAAATVLEQGENTGWKFGT